MKEIITQIFNTPNLKAKFFNTLSLVEYIGARKILKSQPQESYSLDLLNHASEEIRHAKTLKRAALSIAPELCRHYQPAELLSGSAIIEYIQTVDKACGSFSINAYSSYLCTTYILEVRVIQFYSMLDEMLIAMQLHSPFRLILNEEINHLDYVEKRIMADTFLKSVVDKLAKVEAECFENFIKALTYEVNEALLHS